MKKVIVTTQEKTFTTHFHVFTTDEWIRNYFKIGNEILIRAGMECLTSKITSIEIIF